jgi:hypothetical protein
MKIRRSTTPLPQTHPTTWSSSASWLLCGGDLQEPSRQVSKAVTAGFGLPADHAHDSQVRADG